MNVGAVSDAFLVPFNCKCDSPANYQHGTAYRVQHTAVLPQFHETEWALVVGYILFLRQNKMVWPIDDT
jgi:hypothetical protein